MIKQFISPLIEVGDFLNYPLNVKIGECFDNDYESKPIGSYYYYFTETELMWHNPEYKDDVEQYRALADLLYGNNHIIPVITTPEIVGIKSDNYGFNYKVENDDKIHLYVTYNDRTYCVGTFTNEHNAMIFAEIIKRLINSDNISFIKDNKNAF